MDWERPKASIRDDSGGEKAEAPISIWRTYFVANEWNEIQTYRKISPLFQLVMSLLLLVVSILLYAIAHGHWLCILVYLSRSRKRPGDPVKMPVIPGILGNT